MCLSRGLAAVQAAKSEGVLPTKTLGFVPTAGDTYADPYFVDESRKQLRALGIKLVELDVARETRAQLVQKLRRVDGIFVAGGNTFFLLHQLRLKQLDTYIVTKVRNGMPYFGESAGAVVLTASIAPAIPIDDPQDVPDLNDYTSLGLIGFFPLPHIDRDKYKAAFDVFMRDNQSTLEIVRYRDDQAVVTRDGSTYELLPSASMPI